MHEIKVKNLEFSNILSYGNNINEFSFNNGITWIKGPNGSGKSAIVEVLSFLFFGRPYRSVNKKEIKNTANKSKLKVKGSFDRTDSKGTDSYIIKREMANNGTSTCRIYKNDKEEKKEASISQKKLESEILGFNQNIFENIISLNTIQTTPIIDMEPKDNRKLIESVLTLFIDKYKEQNKKVSKEAQTKFTTASSDILKYTKDTDELKVILEKLKQEKEDDIKSLKNQIFDFNELNGKILCEKVAVLIKEGERIAKEGIDKTKEYKKYENIEKTINNYNIIINDLTSIDTLEKTLKNKEKEYEEEQKKNKKITKKINNFKIPEQKEIDKIISNLKVASDKQLELKINVTTSQNKLDDIEKNAKSLKAGIPCPACKKLLNVNDIENLKKDYREDWKKEKKTHDKEEEKYEKAEKKTADLMEQKLKIEHDVTLFEQEELKLQASQTMLDKIFEEKKLVSENMQTHLARINELYGDQTELEQLKKIDFQKEIKTLTSDLEKGKNLKEEIDDLRGKLIKINEKIKFFKKEVETNEKYIEEIEAKIKTKQDKNIDGAYNSTKKKLEDTVKDLERAQTRVTKYSDEIAMTKFIDHMYGDEGIKKLILELYVPDLNKAIAHNLRLFEFPFQIEFNDSMEYNFYSKFGLAQVYKGLSQGQRRKINFAISVAFRDFVTSIADFKINILFLDEVLDISTDDEALKHMLTLLKYKVGEIGGIYLMTHRGESFTEYFDYITEVVHDGRYSSLSRQKIVHTN